MKKSYITPIALVYRRNKEEIFTLKSGEFELIIVDDWYE